MRGRDGRELPPTMPMGPQGAPVGTPFGMPPGAAPPGGPPPFPPPRPPSGGVSGGLVIAAIAGSVGCLALIGLGVVAGAAFFVLSGSREAPEHAYEPYVEPVPPGSPDLAAPGGADPQADERFQVPIAPGTPARGAAQPRVTIVELSDFQCPFCARVEPTLERLLAEYPEDVRIVWMDHPLAFHTSARMAARAAMEAQAQGGDARFWAMHDLLFERYRELSRETILAAGAQLGLDGARLAAAVDGTTYDPAIDADIALAERLGARGTPGFFVNGRQLMGAQPYERFRELVDRELAHARALEASGTPRAALYETITARGRSSAPPREPTPARPEPDATRVHAVPVGDSPVQGPADALVTVVVFSDFECPFCARLTPTLARLREAHPRDVRVVFKHNPLAFHGRAMPAAIAAAEVHRQQGAEAFFRMHDILFESQRALDDASLVAYAERAGASGPRVQAALASQAHARMIASDQDLARTLGVSGTPVSFVNGRVLQGAQPYERFEALLQEELTRARAMVEAGTPRARVYDVIVAGAN